MVKAIVTSVALSCLSIMAVAQERLEIGVGINIFEFAMPWNGGFNAPQFANIDLNRDGIQDLISFDRQGDMLRTYLRAPATGRWILAWEYLPQFPPLVDWVQIVDFDRDGVEDLFTSSSAIGITGITVYKGAVNNGEWSFTKWIDRGKEYLQVADGVNLTNVYVSWDDIPSINDVDGDGDVDVLAFDPGGSHITYFINTSVEKGWGDDSLRFEVEDVCWGKILENELSEEVYLSDTPDDCSDGNYQGGDIITPRHAGSTIMTMDPDFDGDQDAWLGDITSSRLVFLQNGLNSELAWMTAQDAHWPSNDTSVRIPYFVAAYAVELDDDQEPEILAAVNSRSLAEDQKSVWRYDDDDALGGPLSYRLTEKGFLQNEMLDVGSYSRPAVADVNGDGAPDIVIGGYHFEEGNLTRLPSLWMLRNDGSVTSPHYQKGDTDYLGLSAFATLPTFDYAPAFGDIDGDGTIDLVVGDQNGKLFFFKNNAPAGEAFDFESPVYPYMDINVGVSAAPQIEDINGDGLNDLVIGERTGNADNQGRCSNLNYFENIGSAGNAVFNPDVMVSPNTQCFGRVLFDIPIGLPQYSTPVIVKSGNELLLMTGNDRGTLDIYGDVADGITGAIPLIDGNYGGLDFGNRSAPALADLNADGFYELIVGNQRGGLELFTTTIQTGTVGIGDPASFDKPYQLAQVDQNQYEIRWNASGDHIVQLIDMWGRVLSSESVENVVSKSIQLDDWAAGMYFIRIVEGRTSWVEKITRR